MSKEIARKTKEAIKSGENLKAISAPLNNDNFLKLCSNLAPSKAPARVLYAITELYPFVKTGGLGDIAASLPLELKRQGVNIRYFLPGYPAIKQALRRQKILHQFPDYFGAADVRLIVGVLPNGLQAYVLDAPSFFERPHPYLDGAKKDWTDNHLRFGAFCHAAAYLHRYDPSWQADIIHGNDWQCGLIPAYIKLHGLTPRTATIMTIHNVSYQGLFPADTRSALGLPDEGFSQEGFEYYGQLGFLKAGLYYSDKITAVSQTYAHEITTSSKGCGLEGLLKARSHDITGVLNGIDNRVWNPGADTLIAYPFNARRLDERKKNKAHLLEEVGFKNRENAPLFAFVGRLTPQKGVDLLLEALQPLLKDDISFIIMGAGDAKLEEGCRALAAQYPDRVAHVEYEEGIEHRLYAGADAVVVPSHFEPCGLVQLYAARYGALPIVRKTGGLADSITSDRGFIFDPPTVLALRRVLLDAKHLFINAPNTWRSMQLAAMAEDFGWQRASTRYSKIYDYVIERQRVETTAETSAA